MAKQTNLIIENGLRILDIGHRRTADDEVTPSIGLRRSVEEIGHRRSVGDIGHSRVIDDIGHSRVTAPSEIGHNRATITLKEPHMVSRITARRDASGNLHLQLDE